MKKFELGIKLYETAKVTGHYVTKDGRVVNHHFDPYKFVTDGVIIKELALLMKDMIPEGTEIIAGDAFGGAVLATALSLETGLNTAIMRKKAKKGQNLIEGSDLAGKKVLYVTDVLTSTKKTKAAVTKLKEAGANIDTVLCAVRKNAQAPDALAAEGIQLKHAFTMNYLKQLMGD